MKARDARPSAACRRGLTLVELVVVLTLVGILAAVGARLLSGAAIGSQSSQQNLQLAMAADNALRRMARELQAALPNSVRVTTSGGSVFIEFIPVVDGGRLRRATDSTGGGNPLDTEDPLDSSFDVLGPTVSAPAGSQLVVQNLGNDVSDAYGGNNRRSGVVLSGGGSSVSFTPAGAFPDATASTRFFLVGTPITFRCTPAADGTGAWTRHAGYGWQASQPTTLAGASQALLLDGVTACSAAYDDSMANMGVLAIRLSVAQSGATAQLLHQVAVDNTP